MSNRNRVRGPPRSGGHATGQEEQDLWDQIREPLNRIAVLEAKAKTSVQEIFDLEKGMKARELAGTKPSLEEIDELGVLYRQQVKIAEEIKEIHETNQTSMKIAILMGLRAASEKTIAEAAAARASSARDLKSGMDFDGPSDSPVPSPAENKHIRKAAPGRTSSQPPRDREAMKDGKEEKEPSHASRTKVTFNVSEEVAFKPKIAGQTEDHWIQGIVMKVIGEGKSRRYDVQDPEPDDSTKPGEIYRSSASSMIPIPPVGAHLDDYPVEKRVLALYPDTSSFYGAYVKATLEDGAKVQLLFDDETAGALKVVERRFVLDYRI